MMMKMIKNLHFFSCNAYLIPCYSKFRISIYMEDLIMLFIIYYCHYEFANITYGKYRVFSIVSHDKMDQFSFFLSSPSSNRH